MRPGPTASEAWKRMVLRSMPPPLWLTANAPQVDIVVSSRCRIARNLAWAGMPASASDAELERVADAIIAAAEILGLTLQRRMTEAERDFLLGSRLISPEFDPRAPARALLLNEERSISLMVNEEDHIRVQALTPGWSIGEAQSLAAQVADGLAAELPFARDDGGFIAAHPANCGPGRRRSALFHLIGLAHSRRLRAVMEALAASGVVARGLFGESSRAVGAFFQLSTVNGSLADLSGAGEYVLAQESLSRGAISPDEVAQRCDEARLYVVSAIETSLEDALKALAWVRFGASLGLTRVGVRDVDLWISTMEIYGTRDSRTAARHRAEFLRERLEKQALMA